MRDKLFTFRFYYDFRYTLRIQSVIEKSLQTLRLSFAYQNDKKKLYEQLKKFLYREQLFKNSKLHNFFFIKINTQ